MCKLSFFPAARAEKVGRDACCMSADIHGPNGEVQGWCDTYLFVPRQNFDIRSTVAAPLAEPSFEELTVDSPALYAASVVVHLAEIVTDIP